jgi:hypothetical protein
MTDMPDLPKTEIAIVEMTNAFRRENKLGATASEGLLGKAARAYATYLAGTTTFSHEADGRRPSDRIKAAGYAACSTAENLAWMLDSRGFKTADLATKMVEGWKNSPGHRKNMLLEHVTETGVAVVKVKTGEKYIAVQLFGRPQAKQYNFEIRNTAGQKVDYVVGGKSSAVEPNHSVRYTLCDPSELAIIVKAGGLLAKPQTQTFKTDGGQVYRLTKAAGGAVKVEVGKEP